MPRLNITKFLDDEFEQYDDGALHQRARYNPNHRPKRPAAEVATELVEQADGQENFVFSYNASRHERVWIMDSLGEYYENQWIDDILRVIKGGKEATVYQCAAHSSVDVGAYIAAKVYRPRMFRNLKKDHIYREGRANLDSEGNQIIDHGMQHAMQKRSAYGQELLHTSWLEHEFVTLQTLHAAGADVPEAYVSGNNAILMEYVGGPETPAPTLNSIDLSTSEARTLFQRVVHNIDLMLAHNRVHGDLSAYNILYWEGEIHLIDFPQVISPQDNRNAYPIFERDVRRVCEYFASQGVRTDVHRLVSRLWSGRGLPIAPQVHPGLLNEDDEADRKYWRKMTKV
jgi:RIO kinase 1